MRKLLIILFLGVNFLSGVSAQKGPDLKKLDAYITKAMADYQLAGMAVGIVKDGKVVFSKGYGVKNTSSKEPVAPETVFAIASLSKAFTAAAIGILVDEKKIQLDDKVVKYLPDFRLHDPYITAELTVRDLLCHRSGMATFDGDLLWYGTSYSRKEIMDRIKHLPNKHSFRSQFGYQNIMYIAAGELIEAVTGTSWEDFVHERFFIPLNMKSSVSKYSGIARPGINLASPHVGASGKPQQHINYDNSGGAAAINSNIVDLSNWMNMWLNNGKSGDRTILSEKFIETAWSAHTPQPVSKRDRMNGTHFKAYGLGWELNDYNGKQLIHHSGGLPGFISNLSLLPEDKLGIVILTNGESYLPFALTNKILDIYQNNDGKDWAAEYLTSAKNYENYLANQKKEREKNRVQNTSPSLELSKYAGRFNDKMYGQATVQFENNKLTFTMNPTSKLFTSEMTHWHLNTFMVRFDDPFLPEGFVTFEFNSSGNVTGLTIDLPNPDFHFYNLHFKKQN